MQRHQFRLLIASAAVCLSVAGQAALAKDEAVSAPTTLAAADPDTGSLPTSFSATGIDLARHANTQTIQFAPTQGGPNGQAEPNTYALLLASLGVVSFIAYRRRS